MRVLGQSFSNLIDRSYTCGSASSHTLGNHVSSCHLFCYYLQFSLKIFLNVIVRLELKIILLIAITHILLAEHDFKIVYFIFRWIIFSFYTFILSVFQTIFAYRIKPTLPLFIGILLFQLIIILTFTGFILMLIFIFEEVPLIFWIICIRLGSNDIFMSVNISSNFLFKFF